MRVKFSEEFARVLSTLHLWLVENRVGSLTVNVFKGGISSLATSETLKLTAEELVEMIKGQPGIKVTEIRSLPDNMFAIRIADQTSLSSQQKGNDEESVKKISVGG